MVKFVTLLTLLPACSLCAADEQYVEYSGTATSLSSGQFLYGEHDVLALHDGRPASRVVLYTCRNGAAFARKTVDYVQPLAPDFVFEDVANGMREGVQGTSGGRTVFFRGGSGQTEKRAPLPTTAGLVADAGFDEFIHAIWDTLIGGKSVPMPFLVPSRLGDVDFRVQHVRSDHFGGAPAEIFRLRVAGVVGWLVSDIEVTYGTASRVLLRYRGLSDLRDTAGNNYQAQVVFSEQRKPAAAQAGAAARSAALAACR